MSTDNTSRIINDIETKLAMWPSVYISMILDAWQKRIESIMDVVDVDHQDTLHPDIREIEIWKQASKELKIACSIEKGDGLNALQLVLSENKSEKS